MGKWRNFGHFSQKLREINLFNTKLHNSTLSYFQKKVFFFTLPFENCYKPKLWVWLMSVISHFCVLQWLQNESTILGVFWEFLWHKNCVCMNCETNLALECAHKSSWPTAFEKSKIHQPNLEKLQFEGCKILPFLIDFNEKY